MKLKTKLITSALLPLLLALAVGGVVNSVFLIHDIAELNEEQVKNKFIIFRDNINAVTGKMKANGLAVAAAGEALHRRYHTSGSARYKQVLEKYLKETVENRKEALGSGLWYEPYVFGRSTRYMGAYAYWDKDRVAVTWEYNRPEYDYVNREWYTVAIPKEWDRSKPREQDVYVTSPYLDTLYDRLVIFITISVLMYDDTSRIQGVSTTDWSLDIIQDFLKDFYFTKNSFAFLVDKKSTRILYHPHKNFIMNKMDSLPWSRFLKVTDLKKNSLSVVENVIIEDEPYDIYYTETNIGFIFGFAINRDEAYAKVSSVIMRNLVIIISSILLAILLLYWLIDRTFQPVKELNTVVRQFSEKKFTVRAKNLPNDEIGELGASFNSMANSLQKSFVTIQLQEKKYRDIFENAREGIFQISPDGEILLVNQAFLTLFGFNSLLDLGTKTNILEYLCFDKSKQITFLSLIDEDGFVRDFETAAHHWEGKEIIIVFNSHPVYDEKENLLCYEGTVSDITEKRFAEKLKSEKEAADAANDAKSVFLAHVTHEIRTPMNAILGFAELLKNRVADEQAKEYLSAIYTSSKTLLNLINDILDLSKIEAGKLELQYKAVNLNILLKEIELIFSYMLNEKGLDFIVEVHEDFPESLLLDDIRLKQILCNLISNAIKFTEKGSVKVTFLPDYSTAGEGTFDLILLVSDTGIGIADEELERIFDSFIQQKDQDLSRYGGTGLGLAITKRLISIMGGNITVESSRGKGSTFTMRLPNVSEASPDEYIKEDLAEYIDRIQFQNIKILIVDDILYNRVLLKDMIDSPEAQFYEAEDGQEAIELTRRYMPDIILMEIRMPVLMGDEAVRIIKNDESLKHIPVIAITASVLQENERGIRNAGCDSFLLKPIDRFHLVCEMIKYLPYDVKLELTPGRAYKRKVKDPEKEPLSLETVARLPELLLVLKEKYSSQHEALEHGFMMSQLENFARDISALGTEFEFPQLEKWGEELLARVSNFDIEGMLKSFQYLESILEEIIEYLNS
ncbi:MAG: response regulator [bacterium]|nr:response regulator [bacterium]